MFPRLPKLPLICAGLVAVASAAFACGPFFPATIIDQGDASLLGAPVTTFRKILDSIGLPPPEFKAVPSPRIRYHDPDYAAQTLSAELADLRAAGASETVIARQLQRRQLPKITDGTYRESDPITDLPREFALYFTGALAFRNDDLPAARTAFAAVLALPAAERRYKTTWAAYMLGQIARRSGDKTQAVEWFTKTREYARTGFVDSNGLAAASLGEEARVLYDRKDWFPACELYLRQYATADLSAFSSLRFTAAGAIGDTDPAVFTRFAQQPGPRAVVTARLLERYTTPRSGNLEETYPFSLNGELPNSDNALTRWLAALEKTNLTNSREASLFALAAYQAGTFADCARWLKLAPATDAGANWLRAKLALRDGRIDDATALLSSLVQQSAEPFDTPANVPQLQGELAQLRLARRDYTDALRLLLRGDYWEDAAYIAERVLTLDELQKFVSSETVSGDNGPRLKNLLARRLMRAGRPAEASTYFAKDYAATLAEFTAALNAGNDSTRPAIARGLSLARAATLLRKSGMDLQGTELAPDYASEGGSFPGYSFLSIRSKVGGIAPPSDDEISRAIIVPATPNRRFHYRYQAADLAWQAARLLPDNSLELATLLIDAGGWIKARDPQAADRFYKALVTRCPDTDAGREARAKHWFPSP
ncbi:MAG: hypothetical protein WC661_15815 [Opitutaceae bacterium]|jgi:hypothetical protein